MDMIIWALAGAVLGWIGISFLRYNEERGKVVSMVIGAVGGLIGGKTIAPMFIAAAAVPSSFSMSALFFAVAIAAAFLAIGNFVHDRFGF